MTQPPLQQAVGVEGQLVFVHVPFTTSDLLNWKQSAGSYRENPEGMHQLLETIILTQQALLNTFFTAEERRVVIEKAKEEGGRRYERENPDNYTPKTQPDWNADSAAAKATLRQ